MFVSAVDRGRGVSAAQAHGFQLRSEKGCVVAAVSVITEAELAAVVTPPALPTQSTKE